MTVVSIVVPVYNVEEFLSQCLDSLINQSYLNIEIICVNDGSTDSSLKIIEKYSKKDTRVKIISQTNRGLSGARNTGIENAIGEYVGFIDSDDWCHPDMIKTMLGMIKETQVDFVMCGIGLYDQKKGEYFRSDFWEIAGINKEYDGQILTQKDILEFLFDIPINSVNKLFSKKFLIEKQLKFVEKILYEDQNFFTDVAFAMNNCSFTRAPLYIYRINRFDSIMNKKALKEIDDYLLFLSYRLEKYQQKGMTAEQESRFWLYAITFFDEMLERVCESNKKDSFLKISCFFEKISTEALKYILKSANFFIREKVGNYKKAATYEEFLHSSMIVWYGPLRRVIKADRIKYYLLGFSVYEIRLDGGKRFLKFIKF